LSLSFCPFLPPTDNQRTKSPGAIFSASAGAASPRLTVDKTLHQRHVQHLPDGSVFTRSGNNFHASYSGGDGNDLTLTVVP